MTQYIVVEEGNPQGLVDKVNTMISMGYEPLGGVECFTGIMLQAMVKDIALDVISDEFLIKEKGIVPGKTGPEYLFHYEYKGVRGSLNLGRGLTNYTDEELKDIVEHLD